MTKYDKTWVYHLREQSGLTEEEFRHRICAHLRHVSERRLRKLERGSTLPPQWATPEALGAAIVQPLPSDYVQGEPSGKRKRGLKKPVKDAPTTSRKCLRCGRGFPSFGAGNRICIPCKSYTDFQGGF